jgi:hypothetical protein
MAQHDYSIANQGFPATRADINNVLSAISTNNSGTSAPSTQFAGQFWIDTTSSTWTLYIHDGADDIQFATIDTSANTVNFIDSALDVVTDTTIHWRWQLGGEISATGDDTNIDLKLTPKGTGKLNLDGIKFPNADGVNNQILKTDGAGALSFINPPTGFRNIIINGDMSIAQRSTSETGQTSSGYICVDRFQHGINNQGTWTISQSTDVPTGQGFATSMKMDCTTADASPAADDYIWFEQRIEGLANLQHLKKGTSNAESVTVSFWVNATKTGTNVLEFLDKDNTRHICQTYTINLSNTWEKKTITFDPDTTGTFNFDNGESASLLFWIGAGTDYTSGGLDTTWGTFSGRAAHRAGGQVNHADSTSNNFYLTGIQMEAGTTASDFEFLPVDVNLNRCERYYQFIGGTDEGSFAVGISSSITQACVQINFKTTMRTSPSVAISGTLLITDNTSYALAVSALTSSSFNNNSGRIFVTHTGNSTQYRPAFLNPSSTTPADNGVTLSSEL